MKTESELEFHTGIVHRLDKNTTGIMALAKSKEFAHEFSQLLRTREGINKTYLGIVEDLPSSVKQTLRSKVKGPIHEKIDYEGTINAPIRYDLKAMKSKLSAMEEEEAKDSVTHFQILAFVKFEKETPESLKISYLLNPSLYQDYKISDADARKFFEQAHSDDSNIFYNSIIKFNIEGGRKHQIRAHTSMVLGTPLISDSRYGYRRKSEALIDQLFAQIDLDKYERIDKIIINGKEHIVKQKCQEDSEVESHYCKALVDRSFVFLHSMRLEFELNNKKYDIKGDYPPYMQFYLKKIFGDQYEKIEKKFSL